MFENLKKLIQAEHEKQLAEKAFYITNGYYTHWAPDNRNDADRGLRRYSTARRWEQYTAGEISREKAVELATKRATREQEKTTAAALQKLSDAEKAPALDDLTICVHWTRNYYWGYNPTATTYSAGGTHTGRASGCGYDKLSAAVADALNDDTAVMRALYSAADAALAAGADPSSKTACTGYNWTNPLAYGAGYGVLPYFESGVGIDSTFSVLKKCGLSVVVYDRGRKHDDYFRFDRKEGAPE